MGSAWPADEPVQNSRGRGNRGSFSYVYAKVSLVYRPAANLLVYHRLALHCPAVKTLALHSNRPYRATLDQVDRASSVVQ